MAFVGQTADPWDVPVKQAVKVMQKIWDATTDKEYEITISTVVYHKVSDRFFFQHDTNIYITDYSMPCRLMAKCCWFHHHCSPPGIF